MWIYASMPAKLRRVSRGERSNGLRKDRVIATEAFRDWNWEHPAALSEQMEKMLVDLARCEKLEAVAQGPRFDPALLRDLGVTGVEFAAWKTRHPSGLGTDLVSLRTVGDAPHGTTEPGRIYRIDGEYLFTQLDICQPLPFDDDCLEWVYAEHLIEHVSLADAIGWLREVRRILAPGGLFRVTTPDLRRYVESYGRADGLFAAHRLRVAAARFGPRMPERDAFMVNQIFFLWGHRWIYDFDELCYALVSAGFDPEAVRECSYRLGSRADVAGLDQRVRNDETIYVEVTA
jgi:predicted SAM-dependent methyltransferase